MSTTDYAQFAFQTLIAPDRGGRSVKSRMRIVQNRFPDWKSSRIKCTWYADPDMSLKPDEVIQIEKVSGLGYKQFLQQENEEISKADNVLYPSDPDVQRAIFIGIGAFLSALGDKKHLEQFNELSNLGDV